MGADYHDVCPQCRNRKEAELAAATAAHLEYTQTAYGTVVLEEYQAETKRLLDAIVKVAGELEGMEVDSEGATFPEYYEFYIDEDEGVVVADFHGGCRVCNYKVDFKYKHPLPPFSV